jgi:GMP synthase-like glutamine amidotransferase
MVGVLNAYRFDPSPTSYQMEYGTICMDYLKRTFPGQKISSYDIALGKFPESIDECNLWIITGSSKGAYEAEPWIQRLGEFVRESHRIKRKMIGICFGHQLIAHFLGGKTEKSNKGWGVGVRTFNIIKTKPWMTPELKQVSLLFSHQDQVVELPTGAELLGTEEFCPNQMYSIGNHIFCLQGHPEFTPAFSRARLDSRIALIGKEVYDKAIQSLTQKTNAEEVGQWLKNFKT